MNKPKALYIHIPFCKYLCSYCDFTKLQYFSTFVKPYLIKLKEELTSYNIKELDTIYVGGGTPTCLEIDELKELLETIYPYIINIKEYTFEANPDSLTLDKLKLLKRYGVNRLSIGVESTSNKILENISRHHTYEDVIRCVQEAREVGFNNVNVDLILGLPNSTPSLLKKDIDNILALDVEHISCYSLTVNENTKFYIDGVKEPSEDISRQYYDLVSSRLKEKGYIHYEISNWAKKDKYSLHNLTYWKDEQYFGVGLGASGYVNNIRYTNTKSINKYLEGVTRFVEEEVTPKQDINYYIMLNLRTIFGLNFELFNEKFNIDLYKTKQVEIDEFIKSGFLFIENNTLIPTYEGMMILDSIILKLFL